MEKDDEIVTADELGKRLRVKRTTVHRWGREGRIPVIRVTDRTVRFNLRDVMKTLEVAARK